jgi:hypothetical protein
MKKKLLLALPLTAFLLGSAGGCAHGYATTYDEPDDRYRERDPRYESRRDRIEYHRRNVETLRSLAVELDDRSRGFMEIASRRHERRGRERDEELRDEAEKFVERAETFRERLEGRDRELDDVREDIDKLNGAAEKVTRQFREGRGASRAHEEWNGILSILAQVNDVVEGRGDPYDAHQRPAPYDDETSEPRVVVPRNDEDDERPPRS